MSSEQTPPNTAITLGSDMSQEVALKVLNELSEGNYVPRIELVQSNSAARRAKIADDGEFLHNGTTKLTRPFKVVFTDWRSHANMFDDSGNLIAESFNPSDATFKMIKMKEQGPKNPAERPGTGADFLVWLPDYQMFGILQLMKTARRHIKPAYALLTAKKPALVTSSLVDKGNAWWSPVVSVYEGSLSEEQRPSAELLEKALRMFRSQGTAAEQGTPDPNAAADRPR